MSMKLIWLSVADLGRSANHHLKNTLDPWVKKVLNFYHRSLLPITTTNGQKL